MKSIHSLHISFTIAAILLYSTAAHAGQLYINNFTNQPLDVRYKYYNSTEWNNISLGASFDSSSGISINTDGQNIQRIEWGPEGNKKIYGADVKQGTANLKKGKGSFTIGFSPSDPATISLNRYFYDFLPEGSERVTGESSAK